MGGCREEEEKAGKQHISLTTNISKIFVKLQSNPRCSMNIGATQHSQLRHSRARANKGRRQDMYRYFRHMV